MWSGLVAGILLLVVILALNLSFLKIDFFPEFERYRPNQKPLSKSSYEIPDRTLKFVVSMTNNTEKKRPNTTSWPPTSTLTRTAPALTAYEDAVSIDEGGTFGHCALFTEGGLFLGEFVARPAF